MKETVEERSIYDRVFEKYKNSLLFQLALVAFGVFIWVCFCILPARKYAPIAREDAETYAGYFEEVQTENAENRIVFSDGSTYPLDPATETEELTEALNEVPGCALESCECDQRNPKFLDWTKSVLPFSPVWSLE